MDQRRFNSKCPCQMPRTTTRDMALYKNRDSCPVEEGPALAIVYPPYQYFKGLFDPCAALQKGTLFEALDKPFYGTCSGNTIKRGCLNG